MFVVCVIRINLDTHCHIFIDMLMMIMIVLVNSFLLSLFYAISIQRRNPYLSLCVRSFFLFATFRSTIASEQARVQKFKKRKILEITAIYVRVHFFCTYSTSIHISRRLYFSFLSLRLFFPMVGCPTILSL
jgi:hypothetical protein